MKRSVTSSAHLWWASVRSCRFGRLCNGKNHPLFNLLGDRISGTVKRIWDNEVTIEPDYADELQVDLPMVDRIESDSIRELEHRIAAGLEFD